MKRSLCVRGGLGAARAWLVVASVTLSAGGAWGFSISSAVTKACHEPITMEALRKVRLDHPAAAALTSFDRNDLALIEDLPFAVWTDMKDLGAVALVIGVRDNDLKGRDPNELDSLALVHGDPSAQREHCLRGPADDEPSGSDRSLRACRAFIRERFLEALDGLDPAGRPSLDSRLTTAVGLSLRGKVDVPLPRFYVRLGQALHALQDGFSHTYRAADRTRVTAVLNYVDVVDNAYQVGRDGPEHSMELDRCDAADVLRARNRALAVEASVAVLAAALDPALSRDAKGAALDLVLDRYLGYQSGCSASDQWCTAPEAVIASTSGCGCTQGAGWGGLFVCAVALLGARRSGRQVSRARAVRSLVLFLGVGVPTLAQAQVLPESDSVKVSDADREATVGAGEASRAINSPEAATVGAIVPITPAEVQAVQKEQVHRAFFSIYAAGAGSLYNTGVAAMLGVRFRLSDALRVGLDAELNGWYGIHAMKMRTGATNVYASLIVRYPLKYEQINLRSNLQLGIAIQMFDLAGVPAGNVGVFGGVNPLGIEVKLSGHLYLIFYPLGVAIPATQLSGAPFAFVQFRSTLGLELSF